jgi:protein SCO1/2
MEKQHLHMPAPRIARQRGPAAARGFVTKSTAWVLVAAVAAGLGLWTAERVFVTKPAITPAGSAPITPVEPAAPAPPADLRAVRPFPEARAIPSFQLATAGGATFGPADVAGHWTLVFLGFTRCPDVCPTTLALLAGAQKQWEALPEATRPRVLFVSVDPERDTPDAMATYARHFHPATQVATAAEPALGEFVQSLGMVYMKSPLPTGDYTMDHSATIVVLDPQGRQAGLIRPPFDPDAIAADLATLARSAP